MVATILMMAAKYACNDNNNWDLIWMQSQFRRRLNKLAISNPKWTLYACNIFQMGPNMLASIENLFLRYSNKNHSHVCKHIFPLFKGNTGVTFNNVFYIELS